MDKQTRYELTELVREVMTTTLEDLEEKWLSPQQLVEQFACFSTDWLKHYGHLLPRTKASYSNRWCYPMHKINRMLLDGSIKSLTL